MRLTIVVPVFPPEPNISGQLAAQVAEEFTHRGDSVTVITAFPSRPEGKLHQGFRRRLWQKECSPAGYDIIRVFTIFSSQSLMRNRFWEYFSFGLLSSLVLLFSRRPSVVYANTWPLIAQGLLCLAARLRRIPIVLSIQDIYPESLVAQGRIRDGSLFFRILHGLDGWIARSSQALVVISRSFTHVYSNHRKVNPAKISIIPNWFDNDQWSPEMERMVSDRAALRQRLGVPPGVFLIEYAGNVGAAAGLEEILQAMSHLKDQSLHLLVAGDGANLPNCRRLAKQLQISQITFLNPWRSSDTAAVLAAADLFVLPTHGEQSLVSMPSKLMYYLLAARPVVCIASPGSELESIILETDCGWVAPPGDTARLVDVFHQAMTSSSAELQRRGAAGRDYALRHFSKSACLPRLTQVIVEAAHS